MVGMLTIADAGSRKIQGLGMDFSDFIYIYIYTGLKVSTRGFVCLTTYIYIYIYIYIEYRQIDR